jgi:ribose 5-phosphate isomerase B
VWKMARKMVVGCDDAACELKSILKEVLTKQGIEFEDVGVADSSDKTIYPLVAEKVAQAIIDSGYEKQGLLICGTGIGMSISANKFPGIYAAVCHDEFSTERAKLSNNSNVICMGSRVIGPEVAKKNLVHWLGLTFKDGSSTPKVKAIEEFEKRNMK